MFLFLAAVTDAASKSDGKLGTLLIGVFIGWLIWGSHK